MLNTNPILKESSRETGCPTLLRVAPSFLISSVDITLIPSPTQVFDRKQAIIFAPLRINTIAVIVTNTVDINHTWKVARIGWQEKNMEES